MVKPGLQTKGSSFLAQTHAARIAGKGRISIIIPALNEAKNLPQTLHAAQRGQPCEIIVVDGGSTDQSLEVARSMDAIVLNGPRSRALQMNQGAAIATGEYLLFLHADTWLPSDYSVHVPALLRQPGVSGGAFTFGIASDFVGRRLVESTTNWRARRWQLPYGDQALFLRRESFTQLGGFRQVPIMEDYEFVRRLRRLGRIVIAPSTAMTSGRRWQRLGCVPTTLVNKAMILGYHLGVPLSCLAAWYRGERAERATCSRSPEPSCERRQVSEQGSVRVESFVAKGNPE
ncbi:MAG: TIGR04283 family arsenosugar biosynthesis glycosyltransferase [Verrucomicrobia bacterium]|nr:TIGR04283 family arsenosugar biosynthesis glycosyltransferase [Verrucomicrobiota bacterium]